MMTQGYLVLSISDTIFHMCYECNITVTCFFVIILTQFEKWSRRCSGKGSC